MIENTNPTDGHDCTLMQPMCECVCGVWMGNAGEDMKGDSKGNVLNMKMLEHRHASTMWQHFQFMENAQLC